MPLTKEQSRNYIELRLEAAGSKKATIFGAQAIDAIFEASAGIPRRINTLATSALIVAAARKHKTVSAKDVHDAQLERGRA